MDRSNPTRINSSQLFLTYPQCVVTAQQVIANAWLAWPNTLENYCVATEQHQDGTDHLHCYFKLSTKIDLRNFAILDQIGGKHGNYQGCRSTKKVLEYITKGCVYTSDFDVQAQIFAMTNKKKFIGEHILKHGKSPQSLVDLEPAYFMDLPNIVRALDTYRMLSTKRRNHAMEILIFLGEPGTGKSRQVMENWPDAYWLDHPGKWWPNYKNEETVVIDEFTGWLTYEYILRLCDRYPMTVEDKGKHYQFTSKRIVFTSNVSPDNWWVRPMMTNGLPDTVAFVRRVSKIYEGEYTTPKWINPTLPESS